MSTPPDDYKDLIERLTEAEAESGYGDVCADAIAALTSLVQERDALVARVEKQNLQLLDFIRANNELAGTTTDALSRCESLEQATKNFLDAFKHGTHSEWTKEMNALRAALQERGG